MMSAASLPTLNVKYVKHVIIHESFVLLICKLHINAEIYRVSLCLKHTKESHTPNSWHGKACF